MIYDRSGLPAVASHPRPDTEGVANILPRMRAMAERARAEVAAESDQEG